MKIVEDISNWFWAPEFWFPDNVTWTAIVAHREQGYSLPLPRDLWLPVPIALGLFLLRLLWERFVATPVGRHFGISEALPKKAPSNELLQKAYKVHGKRAPHTLFLGLSKQLDWDIRSVQRWWRQRRNQGKASEMQRFRETSWRFLFYLSIFWYGLYVMWDKPYFWDTQHCWHGYPYKEVPGDVRVYVMLELGFYFSLILSLFMDVKRKDFVEMIVHHSATISLLLIAWSINMVAMGCLILVLHDTVDSWMEGAKLAKYCKYDKLCDAMFVVFALLWLVTRIILYPWRILWSSVVESWDILGPHNSYYLYNSLLVTLQALHIIWFVMILRIAHGFLSAGRVEDQRSDTEYVQSDDPQSPLTDPQSPLTDPQSPLTDTKSPLTDTNQNYNVKVAAPPDRQEAKQPDVTVD